MFYQICVTSFLKKKKYWTYRELIIFIGLVIELLNTIPTGLL